jgi:hypothetical protein
MSETTVRDAHVDGADVGTLSDRADVVGGRGGAGLGSAVR